MVVAKKFLLVKHFENDPKESDFKLEEESIPPIKDGGWTVSFEVNCVNKNIRVISEFLAKAVYLSVDPYMRAYAYKLPLGSEMVGGQIAK